MEGALAIRAGGVLVADPGGGGIISGGGMRPGGMTPGGIPVGGTPRPGGGCIIIIIGLRPGGGIIPGGIIILGGIPTWKDEVEINRDKRLLAISFQGTYSLAEACQIWAGRLD